MAAESAYQDREMIFTRVASGGPYIGQEITLFSAEDTMSCSVERTAVGESGPNTAHVGWIDST